MKDQTKKTYLQALKEIVQYFREEQPAISENPGSFNQPVAEYQSCGCGSVGPPGTQAQSSGCCGTDLPAAEYQSCGCGNVGQPGSQTQSSGCCGTDLPAAEYQSCGCGSVGQPGTQAQSSGCCGTDLPAAEYQSCGCGSVGPPGTQAQSSGCCGTDLPAAEYQSCGCGSVDPANKSGSGNLSHFSATINEYTLESGNVVRLAGIKTGEIVLDIGSGGGTDCFEAARLAGPEGKVIGLDPAPEMVELAQNNTKKIGFPNVEFKQGNMENIPLADGSVDLILSNFNFNPTPDKDAVLAEAYRVLKPGGRLNLADTVREQDFLDQVRATGFVKIEILSRMEVQSQAQGNPLRMIRVQAHKPA